MELTFHGGIHNHYYFPPTKKGGAMLYKKDLMNENRDFACALSEIISKLMFVSNSLNENTVEVDGAIDGAASIVSEAAWDLKAIDTALYGTPGELKEFIERHF